MKTPSVEWREIVAPDEEARFARQAELIRAAHAIKNGRYGKGRFLHRKEIIGASGTFEVYSDLPEHAAQGIFRSPASHPAIVRLSNGAFDIQANTTPDIRGFALRIGDVSGPAALGGTADHQDFLLINHDVFGARDSDEFVGMAASAARGKLALIWHLLRTSGLSAALGKLKALAAKLGKPFAGYAAETFNTAVPHKNGPYAVKVLLTPLEPSAAVGADYGEDIRKRIAAGPLRYEMSLQFFTDEDATPIENNTTPWPMNDTPIVAVGRLTLTEAGVSVENANFDPWGGLEDHRPLGEVMRSRKSAYHLSAKARRSA
jgi:hypothetical protein